MAEVPEDETRKHLRRHFPRYDLESSQEQASAISHILVCHLVGLTPSNRDCGSADYHLETAELP